jgi:hypothetical protein
VLKFFGIVLIVIGFSLVTPPGKGSPVAKRGRDEGMQGVPQTPGDGDQPEARKYRLYSILAGVWLMGAGLLCLAFAG